MYHLIVSLMPLGATVQAYLDDFDKFCQKLGGATAEIMGDLLSFEVRTVCLFAKYVMHSASPQRAR